MTETNNMACHKWPEVLYSKCLPRSPITSPYLVHMSATRNKCIATRSKGLASSNKKLLETREHLFCTTWHCMRCAGSTGEFRIRGRFFTVRHVQKAILMPPSATLSANRDLGLDARAALTADRKGQKEERTKDAKQKRCFYHTRA